MAKRNTKHIWKIGERDFAHNCGSFALDLNQWFHPYDIIDGWSDDDRREFALDLWENGEELSEVYERVLSRDVKVILQECDWIEKIDDMHDYMSSDVIIAYRIYFNEESMEEDDLMGIDEDFHFKIRINGIWYEKDGDGPIKYANSQDITDDSGWGDYDSRTIFFRYKTGVVRCSPSLS